MEKLKLIHYRYERDYGTFIGEVNIKLIEFETLRETEFGYWIKLPYRKEKFVLKDSNKRYAYPTKKEAFNSFDIRTNRAAGYAERDLDNAREFLKLIDEFDINTL